VKILYFAWLRQKVGRGEEVVELPVSVKTAGDLVVWLKARSAAHDSAFAEASRVRVAINQVHSDLSAPVSNADEVAFFPPVTGG
jgi:molybdopterin synthase sulfur carrier subunit